jgi:hypothetical protein
MDTGADFQGLVPDPTQSGFKMPNFEPKILLFPLPGTSANDTNDGFGPHGVDHVFENISINFYKLVLHYLLTII